MALLIFTILAACIANILNLKMNMKNALILCPVDRTPKRDLLRKLNSMKQSMDLSSQSAKKKAPTPLRSQSAKQVVSSIQKLH